ncbi:replication initiator protein A [Singulisphaera sp. PoT]|uniref:replication initiator protein A n=1 Tax=Singulisphaera sp. PoT TaxID=3411797 RepID=UPI003BF60282
METELVEHSEPLSVLLGTGKDEMNFAEFPIAMLSDRVPKGKTSIKFEDRIYDDRKKKVIVRKRVIEGSEEYGLPTATDDTVVLALIQLTKLRSNFAKRDVTFTCRELIGMLGWPDDGRSYRRLKLSLLRIVSVNYIYDNSWWDNRQKSWTTKAFHILENVEINDSRTAGGQGLLFPSRVVWNEVVFESFQAGFLRDIDFELCKTIEHHIALRMYRVLGKRFYVNAEWVFDLREFAQVHIGLGEKYEGNAHIARKLEPAIAELEKLRFLAPLSHDERFLKKGRAWSIRFVKFRQHDATLPPPAPLSSTAKAERPSHVKELMARKVAGSTAEKLARRFSPEFILAKIEEFDWRMTTPDKPKRPAGYLVKSIEEEYGTPDGFVSQADRDRQEEARKAKERQAAEGRRQQAEEEARSKAEQKVVDRHWESLTEAQQAELEKAAIAQADPESRKLIEPGPMQKMGMRLLRERYVRQLLSLGQPEDVGA